MAVVLLLSPFLSNAEIKNTSTESVKISGSCALCKEGIETAAFEKNISKASWDKDSKMALVTYNNKKTSIDAVLKKVALAGYDNDWFLAPDDAYAKLADCCKYGRAVKKQPVAEKKMTEHQHGAMTDTQKGRCGREGSIKARFGCLLCR